MNPKAIRALVAKDFTLFFRNRFFALITLLGLVVYVALYFVMPGSVDETLDIGLYAPAWSPAPDEIQQKGLEIHVAESEDDL
jgi:ABC-2 type transport system permease protein